jgi:multidrug efflux pump subunit AcrB
MKSFNLSDWALRHRSLVWYFMIAFMAAGLFAYLQLGRQEDPDFTIKTMVIQAQWPGASPEEMTRQVTDRIEKKLEELESLDYTKSVTVAARPPSSSICGTPQRRLMSNRPGSASAT